MFFRAGVIVTVCGGWEGRNFGCSIAVTVTVCDGWEGRNFD